jgi:hypothetical protein
MKPFVPITSKNSALWSGQKNLIRYYVNIEPKGLNFLCYDTHCAADFSLLNLPKGKSLGHSKPATNS